MPKQALMLKTAAEPKAQLSQRAKDEAKENVLAKEARTVHLKEDTALQIDLEAVTYSALWQHCNRKPQKHWTVRGLTPKEMKAILKQLVEHLAKHQQWKGAPASRELFTVAWQHCVNDCLAQDKNPLNPLTNEEIQFVVGKYIRLAKTDPYTLLNQRPTNCNSATVDLEHNDVVNVAYHAILGLMGNAWKETDHLLDVSECRNNSPSIHNPPPNPPLPLRSQARRPCVVPQRRDAQPTQRKTDYVEICF
jgi:hypothetical protein